MRKYVRGKWPEVVVPADTPVWLYYEVNIDDEVVLRTVETFTDGTHVRNSLSLEERDGFACASLVHGPFGELTIDWPLEEIEASEFENLWIVSVNKPFP
ncbi:hypothetical protein [Asticcacaulis sp. AC460]|uniref:hypothetical protein n=1 Tax=Asticcacaulis sp. AC460 TaxID=1282360 RepID=UPI0012DDFB08|nr:hypothetical protein [Asticcacaulis sp. AC460]